MGYDFYPTEKGREIHEVININFSYNTLYSPILGDTIDDCLYGKKLSETKNILVNLVNKLEKMGDLTQGKAVKAIYELLHLINKYPNATWGVGGLR